MRRTLMLLSVFVLAFALAGCKARELADKAAIAKDLQKRGTTDLMKEVAEDEYTAPEDGRLTDAQVQMYLKVREHEKRIAQVAKAEMEQHARSAEAKGGDKSLSGMMEGFKALGSAADLFTADIRAAKDLGFNTQEYIWVKQQILAASTAQMAARFNEALTAGFDKAYQDARKAYDEAGDAETKKLYADVLAGYDKQRQEMATAQLEEDPAAAYNKQLLSKYENALNAFAHEMSKFENKEGEVAKGVAEFEKNVEGAKKGQ